MHRTRGLGCEWAVPWVQAACFVLLHVQDKEKQTLHAVIDPFTFALSLFLLVSGMHNVEAFLLWFHQSWFDCDEMENEYS